MAMGSHFHDLTDSNGIDFNGIDYNGVDCNGIDYEIDFNDFNTLIQLLELVCTFLGLWDKKIW